MTEYTYGAPRAGDQDEVDTPTGVAPKPERIEIDPTLQASVAAAVNESPVAVVAAAVNESPVAVVARNHAERILAEPPESYGPAARGSFARAALVAERRLNAAEKNNADRAARAEAAAADLVRLGIAAERVDGCYLQLHINPYQAEAIAALIREYGDGEASL